MALRCRYTKRVFKFNFNAQTSRGELLNRTSVFVKIWDHQNPMIFGIGEAAPLNGLSTETLQEIEQEWITFQDQFNAKNIELYTLTELTDVSDFLHQNKIHSAYSSNQFALETALLDWANGGSRIIFNTSFLKGRPIAINGLIWMDEIDQMIRQVETKIQDGYSCLKIKIGNHNFEQECEMLEYIRKKYTEKKISLRLDANGAFRPEQALDKLERLSQYNIHSIEQPIPKGSPSMAHICAQSPIPIALDEELIGVTTISQKKQLLQVVKPTYLILKPSLHGGLLSCIQWIALAQEAGIGWWLTSALESTIGLNAIAQFSSSYPITIPQGLGTGMIYQNNIDSPLVVKNAALYYNTDLAWNINVINDKTEKY